MAAQESTNQTAPPIYQSPNAPPAGTPPVAPPPPENNPEGANFVGEKPISTGAPASVVATPGAPGTPGETGEVVTSSRSKFPKKLLIILLVLALLGSASYLVYKYVLTGRTANTAVELTWWGLWEDEALVRPVIEKYESENPNVNITYVKQAKEDYRERLTNAIIRGDGPDIFRYHNTWVPMFSEYLAPLPSSVMSPSSYTQTFYPVATNDLAVGTNIYGIPLEYDGLVMFVNNEHFENAGIAAPDNWDKIREVARQLTIKDEEDAILQSGIALGTVENVDHWEEIVALMMLQNGADPAKPNNELAQDALVFYTLFNTQDEVWDETMPPSTVAFANGLVSMYIAPSWRAFNIKETNPTLDFKAVVLPQLPKETGTEPDVSYATYWVEGVSSKSANKEAAWQFLKFASEEENLQQLYSTASQTRAFGEPYSRIDMRELLLDDPYLGALMSQAGDAKSWYLASRTYDGTTGINSQVSEYYKDAVNSLLAEESPEEVTLTLEQGLQQVLSRYNLISN